jgi:hypothetical protein
VQGGGDGKIQGDPLRIDTIAKQAEMMVEAHSEEEARRIILADLEIDPGSSDDDLEPVSKGTRTSSPDSIPRAYDGGMAFPIQAAYGRSRN